MYATIRPFARPLVTAALILGLSFGGASADASVILGCKNKTNGAVRIVAEVATCRNSEVAVYWNSQGEVGPAGGGSFVFAAEAVGEADVFLRGGEAGEGWEVVDVGDFGVGADHVGLAGEDEDAEGFCGVGGDG